MRKLIVGLVVLVAGISASAQDMSKPWDQWSKKDTEKVLNDSPWGQTFTQEPTGPVSTSVVTTTRGGMAAGDTRNVESGEVKPTGVVKYRARFLTAKPVREAFSRMVLLSQPNAPADLKTQLQGFVDRDFGDFLVISFSIDSDEPRVVKGAVMTLTRLNAEMLKNKVYLERKDGQRATLIDYKPPVEDGMGAKIVFSRTLDGKPFLAEGEEAVKFFLQLSDKQKISMKFKVPGMSYGGKLEY